MKILTILALFLICTLSWKILKRQHQKPKTQTNILSMYYCGFGQDFCGQSTTDDVHTSATNVILAFSVTQPDGSIIIDEQNFPATPYAYWKAAGKNVLISAGGQYGNWDSIFASNTSITNFVNSMLDVVTRFKLDGVDLDIQSYNAPPRTVANTIIQLKTALLTIRSDMLLIVSPECVTILQEVLAIPDADTGSGYYNYFVNIIKIADAYIDYYQPQAYNNWYQVPSGSLEFIQNVYLNWRNFKGLCPWGSEPIPDFTGVAGEKLVMGILGSLDAGGSAYYYTPEVITAFRAWLIEKNYPLAGFMIWDSNWDHLNGNAMSTACTQ